MIYVQVSRRKKCTSFTARARPDTIVGFLVVGFAGSKAAVVAQQPPPDTLAPDWIESLPFVVRLEGGIRETSSSSYGGFHETRMDQHGEIGVMATASGSNDGQGGGLGGSAWIHVANEMGMDPGTQLDFGAKNDYEVTHFDGRGGAVRMMARQCPSPVSDGSQLTQGYIDETGAGYQPCQCSFEATPIEGVPGCTLPTKFSCLPQWETCVTSESDGCPLSEAIQRRSWGYAPPNCNVRPLEQEELPEGVLPPWGDDAQFAVCRSLYAFGGQIEAVSVGENDDDGIPAYDVEGFCAVTHQSSSCTTSYATVVETLAPEIPATFLDADPAGFVACLGENGAADASEAFCNGRGSWTWDENGAGFDGDEPSPFRCVCDEPTKWTGDRCDEAVLVPCSPCHYGTSGPCQHNAAGDATCVEKMVDGSCPPGFSECLTDLARDVDNRDISTDGLLCDGCFGQSLGPCKNPNDSVCHGFHYDNVCPPGTQPCQ